MQITALWCKLSFFWQFFSQIVAISNFCDLLDWSIFEILLVRKISLKKIWDARVLFWLQLIMRRNKWLSRGIFSPSILFSLAKLQIDEYWIPPLPPSLPSLLYELRHPGGDMGGGGRCWYNLASKCFSKICSAMQLHWTIVFFGDHKVLKSLTVVKSTEFLRKNNYSDEFKVPSAHFVLVHSPFSSVNYS